MAQTAEKMVVAVFRDRSHANHVYSWLRERGYTTDEINVLMSDQTRMAYADNEEAEELVTSGTHAAEGVATGGAIGTAVGALAVIAAISAGVAIPGLGVLAAGPILAAFAGAGAGAVAGGLIGGLVGLGIPESNATAYEQALKDGGVVIGVTPHSEGDADHIRDCFEKHQGENVIVV
jgi:predicted phage tail protein